MGGKNTPASGFMLLMNHLMKTIAAPPETESEKNKILIVTDGNQPQSVKSAYILTQELRAKGFIASIQVDNEDKADYKWIIEVGGKSPEFAVIDQSTKKKFTPLTAGEVNKLLGGQGGS
jgi:histidyl-tRNA synthetase